MRLKTRTIKSEAVTSVRSAKKRAALAADYGVAAIPKHAPERDPKLRAWIAKQRCLIERITGTVCSMKTHAAHVPTGTHGIGMKGDDLFVPLCFDHHINQQHARGTATFQARYDLHAEALAYRDAFRRTQ